MLELESGKDRTVSFRINGEASAKLELQAQKRNTSMSAVLRELIENVADAIEPCPALVISLDRVPRRLGNIGV